MSIGRDPFHAEALWAEMSDTLYGRGGGMLAEAIAGVDIALWDVMGRSLGVPIHRLLGGVGRETLSAYASSIMVEGMDETRLAAEQLAASKFRAVKLKVAGDLERDLERVALVRSILGPDTRLFVDVNWGYTVDEALAFGRSSRQIRHRMAGGAAPPARPGGLHPARAAVGGPHRRRRERVHRRRASRTCSRPRACRTCSRT